MSVLPKHEMNADEFRVWAGRQPKEAGRFELLDGHVVTLQSERLVHTETKSGLYFALRLAIGRAGLSCFALSEGPLIKISATRSFQPDALVYCGERRSADNVEIADPIIVCEVLSPDSIARDHGEKLVGYFSLASIQHYLIVDPDKNMLIHHRRGQGEDIITRVYSAGSVTMEPPGITIALADIFEREPRPDPVEEQRA